MSADVALYDRVQKIPVEELRLYDSNPKEHPSEQVDKIARSIQDFGFTVPLVIRDDNTIIMGHGRLYAARQLDLETVPCIVRDDLTEAEARALRIADNRVRRICASDKFWNAKKQAQVDTMQHEINIKRLFEAYSPENLPAQYLSTYKDIRHRSLN